MRPAPFMLTVVKRLRQSLTEWAPKAFKFEAAGASGEPPDEFPYVPEKNVKRKYMEDRWTALPPRRRSKRPAADLAPPAAPTARPAEAAEASFAERAASNAESVAANVAKRIAAHKVARPEVPSAPDKVFAGDWEHLDHTADVQFHAWAQDLDGALANLGMCLFDYVTELVTIDRDPDCAETFDIECSDVEKLVFKLLDELLYRFSADGVACRDVSVRITRRPDAGGEGAYAATVSTTGERFDLAKHPQGTEVKAITYSNMQIHEGDGKTDIFVIVDI